MQKEQNLIKKTAKELDLTYKELGDLMGFSESSIARLANSDKITKRAQKAIEMLIQINADKILENQKEKKMKIWLTNGEDHCFEGETYQKLLANIMLFGINNPDTSELDGLGVFEYNSIDNELEDLEYIYPEDWGYEDVNWDDLSKDEKRKLFNESYALKGDENLLFRNQKNGTEHFFKIPQKFLKDKEKMAKYIVKNLLEEVSGFKYLIPLINPKNKEIVLMTLNQIQFGIDNKVF